jgi:hypothetical protein
VCYDSVEIPRAAEPVFQHLLKTYASEANTSAGVWRAVPDALFDFRPHPRTNPIRTIQVHRLLSERRFAGEAGEIWLVERGDGGWWQVPEAAGPPTSTVTMDADTAWRQVTKRRMPDEARRLFPDIRVDGDERLGTPVLGTMSIMA